MKKQGTIKTACGRQSQTSVVFYILCVHMLIKYPGKENASNRVSQELALELLFTSKHSLLVFVLALYKFLT